MYTHVNKWRNGMGIINHNHSGVGLWQCSTVRICYKSPINPKGLCLFDIKILI